MIFWIFLLQLFFFFSPQACVDNPPQQAKTTEQLTVIPAPNITVNIPMNVALNNQNTSTTGVETSTQSHSFALATANNKNWTSIITNTVNKIQTKLKSIKEYGKNLPNRLRPWALEYKWRIVAGCATGLYVATWYRVMQLTYALTEPEAWHNYKKNSSFDELLSMEQNELGKDIVRAIQRRYAPQAGQDFFMPFRLFSKEIENEIKLLQELITLYKRIHMLRASWLFPGRHYSLHHIQEKLRRILYLQNMAFAWLGSFKFEKYSQLAPEHIFKN